MERIKIWLSKRRNQHRLALLAGLVFAVTVTGITVYGGTTHVQKKIAKEQKELAGEVLRFHILANSNGTEDQELKLQVKEKVLNYMKKELPHAESLQETKLWVKEHLAEIEQVAGDYIEEEGFSYNVKASLSACEFPDKTYGDVTFPAGTYEALRVEIGQAKGRNWWCCLYPNLCFVDATEAVVPEEGKEELASVLDEEAYEMITTTTKFKIKWFFLKED